MGCLPCWQGLIWDVKHRQEWARRGGGGVGRRRQSKACSGDGGFFKGKENTGCFPSGRKEGLRSCRPRGGQAAGC